MKDDRLDPGRSFDAIIVGAGPAGCVLANRLSEVPGKDVLLIEAGPDVMAPGHEHPDLLDPFCLIATNNPHFRWPKLRSENASPASARDMGPYIQGYGVGGASNINGMGVDRGQPGDYDDWCNLGAEGWSWDDVLPYFIKLERDLDFSGPMHGDRGPMPVRRLSQDQWAPFASAVGHALLRRGFPLIDDYLTNFSDGLSAVPTNCMRHRVSAAMAYLTSSTRQRKNLQILSGAIADRVNFDARRASGVFVRIQGRTILIRGRKVILTCGAIHTPALLMRSGIGPRHTLARFEIGCVHELRGVGSNLQNHPHVTMTVYLRKASAQQSENPWLLQNWLRFSSRHPECPPGDMHLMIFNRCAWHPLGERVGALVVSVLKSYATGRVELTSAAPAELPRVQFNTSPDPRDDERLIAGVRLALELLEDSDVLTHRHEMFTPNQRLVQGLSPRTTGNRIKASVIAGLLDQPVLRRRLLLDVAIDPLTLLRSDRRLAQFVQANTNVQFHVCGTCLMGPSSNADAVVDSVGQVHGTSSLQIADASIFPTAPRGYPHFIVLMAAEKIADAIKVDWVRTSGLTREPRSRELVGPSF